ncbi:LAQU0S09e02014g1_1 [Lachancea quebecensis]|uniref:LAQU0S09e02014g1_1 n=1 Tax=Lachancea quebecensis TaxID=1654605 RepID=A0A0N7MLV1_9SACH|nr:LAQU0S09e02014g1_1 [Lachancea quebecensis]
MARISYVSPYFMPLVCSSKPWVSAIVFLNLIVLFVAAFSLSQLLISQYDDDAMFKPVGQDYFRTSLLGFFSPLALYFIRDFVLMVSPRFVLFNLFVDFPLNDWLYLLIIFCLAYPQAQETHARGSFDDTFWHIIPRQSCIFGISWALSEFMVCLVENFYSYEEVPSPESAKRQLESKLMQDEQDLVRSNITLSKCIDLKRRTSHISENVYCHDNGQPPQGARSPGSTAAEGGSADTVFVSFSDSSISLLRDPEQGPHPGPRNDRKRSGLYSGTVTYFPEVVSVRQFLKDLLVLNLLVADSILIAVGHALLISMYFIYVPGHERLFTSAVIYFGSGPFGFFVLSVVLPLSIFSFIASVFLFLWKDEDHEDYSNPRKTADSDLHIHTSHPQSLQYITSDQLFVVNSIYTQDISGTEGDNELGILRFFRALMATWRSLALYQCFPIAGITLWALTVFVGGIAATIEQ